MLRKNKKKINLIIGLICSACVISLAFFAEPAGFYIPLFYVLVFLSAYSLLKLITRFSFSFAVAAAGYLLLRMLGLDSNINNILLVVLVLALLVFQSH